MDEQALKSLVARKAGATGNVTVALSGGVDSGLVAWAAQEVLGPRATAVSVVSELTPTEEAKRAADVARYIGINYYPLQLQALAFKDIRENGPLRCYHCKKKIIETVAQYFGPEVLIMDGTNADDDPLRPGLRALKEYDVFSPLLQAGLGKQRIRTLASGIGLPNSNAPSESCLATRIPAGSPLTHHALHVVETLEGYCRSLGLESLRVWCDDMVAIVEYLPQYSDIMEKNRDSIVNLAQRIGIRSCDFKEWTDES